MSRRPLASEDRQQASVDFDSVLPRGPRLVGTGANQRPHPGEFACDLVFFYPRANIAIVNVEQVGPLLGCALDGIVQRLPDFGGSEEGFALVRKDETEAFFLWRFNQKPARSRTIQQQMATAYQIEMVR